MINEIKISVKARRAEWTSGEYICANSDFPVVFDFDEEWNSFDVKTAIFSHDGIDDPVVFNGSTCFVPNIVRAYNLTVGVTAGDLRTTTVARVPVEQSALSKPGMPPNPQPDVYAQIMDLLNKGGASAEAIQQAVQDYLEKNPPPGVSDDHIREVTAAQLQEAKESGEFDGPTGDPGASAYQIAVKAGFEGTEEEWLASLKGERYVLTPVDKEEITAAVISALPIYDGEVVDE